MARSINLKQSGVKNARIHWIDVSYFRSNYQGQKSRGSRVFFDDIYLDASININENSGVEILSDNTDLIENYWEIED